MKDILVTILIVCFIFWYKTKQMPFSLGIDMSGFPVGAAEFILENKIAPNMFNHYNYGGFLIWKMPGYKVFIDGRLEMYLGQAGQDYLVLEGGREGWEKIIEKYKVNFVLNYASTSLTKVLLSRDDWRLVYFDSQYVVFVKNDKINQEVIDKYYSPELAKAYQDEFTRTLAEKSSQEYNQEGLKKVKEGKLKEALRQFEIAVLVDSSNLTAVLNLGQVYTDNRRYQEALEAYKLALMIDPENQIAKDRIDYLAKVTTFD